MCVVDHSNESISLLRLVLRGEQLSVRFVANCILRELAAEDLEKLSISKDQQEAGHRCLWVRIASKSAVDPTLAAQIGPKYQPNDEPDKSNSTC